MINSSVSIECSVFQIPTHLPQRCHLGAQESGVIYVRLVVEGWWLLDIPCDLLLGPLPVLVTTVCGQDNSWYILCLLLRTQKAPLLTLILALMVMWTTLRPAMTLMHSLLGSTSSGFHTSKIILSENSYQTFGNWSCSTSGTWGLRAADSPEERQVQLHFW